MSGTYLVTGRAKVIKVEVRVTGHEGVEGPVHGIDLAGAQLLLLGQLEPPADPHVTRIGPNGEHVGPVCQFAPTDPGHPENDAEQVTTGTERTGADPPHLHRDLHYAHGYDIGEAVAPRLTLKVDAGDILLRRPDRTNLDIRRGRQGRNAC